ncbi:hypothetical protein BGW80DRAFT_1563004 [Lactifluus volemus]|nr:hypothetical protein BGW80DRAFT_1563004 [Lactifluus volemus]
MPVSSPSDSDLAAAVDRVARCLSNWRLSSDLADASGTLIFFDWLLTLDDELNFIWLRGKITCIQVLFVFARYAALANAILSFFPPGIAKDQAKEILRGGIMLAAEREYISHDAADTRPLMQPVIIMMRTWAMWGRSRRMLISLIVFLWSEVCAIPGVVLEVVDLFTSAQIPASIPIKGMKPCEILTGAVGHIWVVEYFLVMLFEAGMLVLTVYKALPLRDSTSRQMRSKLLDTLWIDGAIYFVFMIREFYGLSKFSLPNSNLFHVVIGFLNIGLVLQSSDPQIRSSGSELQAVLHSVLSTRIVLHISTVREGGIVSVY